MLWLKLRVDGGIDLHFRVRVSNSELRAEVSANCFRRFLRSDRAVMSVTAQSLRRSGAFSADLSLERKFLFQDKAADDHSLEP